MEGQGEGATTFNPDLPVFMGGDNGFLALVSVPEVKSVADLKGRTVSVDALTTGYAFVLLDLLKRGGLKEGDYKVEKAGGVMGRWEAIREKKHDATMLITPFDIMAKANGLNVLQKRHRHLWQLPGSRCRGAARMGAQNPAWLDHTSAARSPALPSCAIRRTRPKRLRFCARICRR